MRKTESISIRKKLLKELQMVSRHPGLRDQLRVESHSESIDQLQAEEDRELASERIEEHTRITHAIEAALRKLDEGSYGTCETCECKIPAPRLKAIPWTALCVRCQSLQEREAA